MADAVEQAHRTAERVARESYGRLLAFLVVRTRDVEGAEDALGDAFAAALRTWPHRGVPANPDAWLLTAARNRLTDAGRRHRTQEMGHEQLRVMAEEIDQAFQTPEEIPDRRLALMFGCAHPAIDASIRAPLILQTILGLTADAIAAALLLPAATMSQRLVRAKTRIRQAGIPFRIPDRDELPERLGAVLEAIYAAYSKGWAEIGEDGGSPLADEAIWLGRLVVSLLPEEPEAKGMLALMLYTEARREARRDSSGAYVPFGQQDVALWDEAQLRMAEALLHQANAAGPSGRYQIEAAIQSAHIAHRVSGLDTRRAILALYDHLLVLIGSPVAALNRVVALAAVEGSDAALNEMRPLASDLRMLRYQPYWAVRGHLLAEVGRKSEAQEALTVAMGLSTDDAVTRYLQDKCEALAASD